MSLSAPDVWGIIALTKQFPVESKYFWEILDHAKMSENCPKLFYVVIATKISLIMKIPSNVS